MAPSMRLIGSKHSAMSSKSIGDLLDLISFGAALAVAALTGLAWFIFDSWFSAIARPRHQQTVALTTKETPNQVLRGALWAMV